MIECNPVSNETLSKPLFFNWLPARGTKVEYRPIIAAQGQATVVRVGDRGRLVRRLITSNRYVLGIALVVSIAIPFVVSFSLAQQGPADHIPVNLLPTLLAAAIAVCVGHFSLRRIGGLPLVRTGSLIFPTLLGSFGVCFFGLYVTRSPIGLKALAASFVLAIIWYLFISVMRGRYLHPLIGLVGVTLSDVSTLPDRADWHVMREPRLPDGVSAIAYDPHVQLSMRWSSFITKMVLRGVPVYHLSHIEEGLTGKVRFNHDSENEFGALLPSLFYIRIKRVVDLSIGLITLPAVLLILGIAALLIRLESPGPALFRQIRMGHRGRAFVCLKLRTMRQDMAGPAFTVDKDPRITRLGSYLRKWRIDELPQVMNVIWGEMSWIGPRPEALSLARRYARHVPFYGYRHAVRPGITGWAAVHQGNVNDVAAAQEKLEFDFYYIRYFSFWLDVLIVLKTIRTILTGFGSK